MKLDLRKLARQGWLDRAHVGSLGSSLLLDMRDDMVRVIHAERGAAWQQTLLIARTRCSPFGGSRPWFRCPAHGCNRRAAILYSAGGPFACRRCLGLAYRTQHEQPDGRLLIKAERQWARLGWDFGEEGEKPKGMYWRTFNRIADRAANAYEASFLASRFARRFARMGR